MTTGRSSLWTFRRTKRSCWTASEARRWRFRRPSSRANAREVGLYVLRSPDGAERTRISLYPQDNRRFDTSSLQIDGAEASLRGDVFARTPETGPIRMAQDEPLRLRIFVDRSIVEVFANDRQCLTLRVYPQREDSSGVSVFARGNSARLASFDIWQMRSIWD